MKRVIVCINHRANLTQPSCAARGSANLADRLEQEIARRGWPIRLERFPCLGRCDEGPNLKLVPGGHFICNTTPDKFESMLQQIETFAMLPD